MKKSEYVKTITIKDQEIRIGKDDYGQCYFVEWTDDEGSHEMGLGTYNEDIMGDLLYIFDPGYCELMRKIYLDDTLTDEELERKTYYEKLIETM